MLKVLKISPKNFTSFINFKTDNLLLFKQKTLRILKNLINIFQFSSTYFSKWPQKIIILI